MTQSVELKYGDSTITLRKSAKLIAVKARKARRSAAKHSVSSVGGVSTRRQLSGFDIVDVGQASQPMESALDALRMDDAVSAGSHVYHTPGAEAPFVPTGRLFVAFKQSASIEECRKLIDTHHLKVIEEISAREFIVEITKQSLNPIKVAAALQASPFVEVAEPDLATQGKLAAFAIPSDDKLRMQWHLQNTSTDIASQAGADARVVEAWKQAKTLGRSNVVVAVIDDGFDLDHPDLAIRSKLVSPRDFARNGDNPIPDAATKDWHGTACSGVAIGRANKRGILGAAPNCRFMPIRWTEELSDASVKAWFDYVTDHGAWVVSCSWGAEAKAFPLSELKKRAIRRCATEGRSGKGIVVCFAAGNEARDVNDPADGSVCGFAIHPDVIAVSASTSRDQRANYTNFGREIAVCAPSSGAGGKGVFTADVTGSLGYDPGDFTSNFTGTSSATPLVAGICALVLSVNPKLNAAQVKALIQETARKIGDASNYDAQGHSTHFGYGCVNALEAVKRAKALIGSS